MKISEYEARRQLEAREPGRNTMGGERFQIVHKVWRDSPIKGRPRVAVVTKIGNFEPF